MLQEMKVFTIDAMTSNSMKSNNPYSGIHETETAKCLDTMCLDPSCNQGGHMVCIALEGNGARPSHMGKGFSEDGSMYTLNTIEQHSVCYSVDCRNVCLNEEVSCTLQAKPQGGWSVNVTNPVVYAIENHPNDSRIRIDQDGIVQTLSSRMGTGGNNTPFVLIQNKECYAVDSHPMDSRITIAGNVSPSITSKLAKLASDGPLVLIKENT